MVVYSVLLVDLSPTSYCLPKPLLVYGSMLLLSTFILSSYSVIVVIMLGYDWGLRMVINISVQYNKQWVSPRHYIVDPKLTRIPYCSSGLSNTIPDGILYCICFCFSCTLLPDIILLTQSMLCPSPRQYTVDPMVSHRGTCVGEASWASP